MLLHSALALCLTIGNVCGQSATILLPSQDPFYVAAPNYALTAPGSILKIRVAPGGLSTVFNASAAYQIQYRTTDSNYAPSYAVTTLFVPRIANGSKLYSAQLPYDVADVDQSPSYTLHQGGVSDITTGLQKGWYVACPDYEGPLAAFTAGVQSGHATLDNIRAILNAGLGLSANTRYAMGGYSGGALASEWAAELAVQYAPELSFAGMSVGGLTPNVTSVRETIDGTIYAGIIVSSIVGLAAEFPAFNATLATELKPSGPENATTFYNVRNQSLGSYITTFSRQNISDYFTAGEAVFSLPMATAVLNSNGMMGYHGVPQMPVFAYKAIGDDLSPVADTDKLIARYCEVGANFIYNRNTIGNHATEQVNGDSRNIAFLSDVLSGTYNHTGCTILNVTNSGNSSVYY